MTEKARANSREMGLSSRQPRVRDSGEFEITEFEIARFYCIPK